MAISFEGHVLACICGMVMRLGVLLHLLDFPPLKFQEYMLFGLEFMHNNVTGGRNMMIQGVVSRS